MKRGWKQVLLAILMGAVLPGAVIRIGGWTNAPEASPTEQRTEAPETKPETSPGQPEAFFVKVLLTEEHSENMELDDYLTGVVLGEMPADFEPEALKAQAVVARTYTLRVCDSGKKHSGGICTDSVCCQSYISPEEYISQGGTRASVDKIRGAVAATHSQVLTYGGELIQATYFSCSGGRTEDAVAVWGADVPYLRSTDSPGEEGAAHYTDTVCFSARAFASALGIGLAGNPTTWLGDVTYTDGGGVDTMIIGGMTFRGTELRQRLALRSTAFTMTATRDGITVTTKGYGHRVGMSQYGADAMAASGSTYTQILAHYYQGTELESR